jgi:hypothetical protein
MTSSITRQKILCHTYYELIRRVTSFNHDDYDQPHAWKILAESLERAAEALLVQTADYRDALDYEEEAARRQKPNTAKKKTQKKPTPYSDHEPQ